MEIERKSDFAEGKDVLSKIDECAEEFRLKYGEQLLQVGSDDDLIRRGDALQAIRKSCILEHLPFSSSTPEGKRTLEALAAVYGVQAADANLAELKENLDAAQKILREYGCSFCTHAKDHCEVAADCCSCQDECCPCKDCWNDGEYPNFSFVGWPELKRMVKENG